MKKKLLTIVMICALAAGLSACGRGTSNQQSDNTGKTASTEAAPTGKTENEKRMAGFSAREISDDLFERMKGGNTYI